MLVAPIGLPPTPSGGERRPLVARSGAGCSRALPSARESPPDELCPSASSRELDVRLAHLLDPRDIGLVTGDSGSGKTCAARRVLTQLHTGLLSRALRVALHRQRHGPLQDPLLGMGLSVERSRAGLYRQIKSEVARLCADARTRPILVVDEAHRLRPDVLEDLRLLTDYQMDAEPRLCLLLVGQTASPTPQNTTSAFCRSAASPISLCCTASS